MRDRRALSYFLLRAANHLVSPRDENSALSYFCKETSCSGTSRRLGTIMMPGPAPFRSDMQALVAKFVLLLTLALPAPALLAQDVAPDALLRAVTVKVIDKIKEDQG